MVLYIREQLNSTNWLGERFWELKLMLKPLVGDMVSGFTIGGVLYKLISDNVHPNLHLLSF